MALEAGKPKKAIALGGRTLRTVKATRRSTKPRKGVFNDMGNRPGARSRQVAAGMRSPTFIKPIDWKPPAPTAAATVRKRKR